MSIADSILTGTKTMSENFSEENILRLFGDDLHILACDFNRRRRWRKQNAKFR